MTMELVKPISPTPAHDAPAHDSHANDSGLVAQYLGKSYRKKRVVRGASFALQRGEAVGLLGPNGAGKTTCFHMMSGLIKTDEGHIFLDGEDITALPMYRRARLGVGYLPQESSIFQGLSVEENIMAVLQMVEADSDARIATLDELLDEFHITHLRGANASTLSGGERRRVEIARAMASRPSFLMLDEPLAGIDPIAVSEIRELIGRLKAHHLGVLITDHNVREALNIIDRGYILNDGTIFITGTPQEIIGNQDVRKFYLGEQFTR